MKKRTMSYRTLCLAWAVMLAGGPSPAGAGQDAATLDQRVAAIVASELLAKGVPSASVAVMREGKMIVQGAWGVADTERKTPARISTTYQIASSTKQFTASLVLKQVDRGRLSLGDSITKHLAGLPQAFDAITIEQLLNHTSGLSNDFRDPEKRLETRTSADLLSLIAATAPANAPGTTFLYSNTGYALLGLLVEKTYGKRYADVLRDEIAAPLGLALAKCAEPRPDDATGYRRTEDGSLAPPPGLHHSQMLGVGGICATPGDLVKWTHALHTGKVLAPATYTAMTTPRGPAAASNYGFGSYVRPAPWGGITITHGGVTTTGHVSEMQWYPKASVAYALLYNAAPRVPGVSDLIPRLVLGVPPASKPAEPASQQPGGLNERVAAIVKREILSQGAPSAAVAVLRDGQIILDQAWGVTDVGTNANASPATTYAIGSVTKQFTAVLLLKQVERGRLALSDPIGKHLAGLTPESGAVTVEQLLNHTSGLQRSIGDPERRFDPVTTDALLAMALRENPTHPGTKFEYSNAGYAVLGVLVEKLYGKSYREALREEISTPLGLTTLTKCDTPGPAQATGYSRAGGKPGPPPGMHHSLALGADGICATAADLVRWTHALHAGQVLSNATYEAMTTPRGAATKANYGLGLSVSLAPWDARVIAHGGQALTGHVAELSWYPEQKVAVALLYNAFPRVPGIADLIPRVVLGVPLPEKTAAPGSAAPPTAAAAEPVKPADRATLVGIYEFRPQRNFEVTLENGELHLTPPSGAKEALVHRSGNTYARASEAAITLTFIVENGVASRIDVNDNGRALTLKKIK